ncbi:MAG: DUF1223 domain-containing protein [Pseudomonadota bacterium]
MRHWIFACAFAFCAPPVLSDTRPVVVELFTSQGCSSCPPADAVLHDLAKDPQVIALALHVDYWDYIGWVDEFADPAFTKRQKSYAMTHGEKTVYTPQMRINGLDHVVGSRRNDVTALVSQQKSLAMGATVQAERSAHTITLSLTPGNASGPFIVHVVHYRPLSTVDIKRGENAGRRLSYANVVTDWRSVAEWDGIQPKSFNVTAPAGPTAVLVQKAGYGEIVTATHVR